MKERKCERKKMIVRMCETKILCVKERKKTKKKKQRLHKRIKEVKRAWVGVKIKQKRKKMCEKFVFFQKCLFDSY